MDEVVKKVLRSVRLLILNILIKLYTSCVSNLEFLISIFRKKKRNSKMTFRIVFCTLILRSIPLMALILSKSKIQYCEDKGLHGQGDPQNLVDGKACEKKITVLMSVNNGQVSMC